jgi:hypothetical protein
MAVPGITRFDAYVIVDWSAAAKPAWTLEMRDINDYDEITFRHTDIRYSWPALRSAISNPM